MAQDFLRGFDDSRYPTDFTGRYEAMECLSSGQHHETLLVREKATGRLLVAKCYEKGHHLFGLTEPEELRALSHPGLPTYVGEVRGETMRCVLREHVEGKTLWELGLEGPFTEETTRRIGLELCGILKYLHGRRPPVIHRDIKPQNVVMRGDGSPTLIDLGISRLYVEGARSDTVFCGTQDFAPPEQYGFLQTDCRSDIYSLGILLAWMLTGEAAPILKPQTPLERVIAKSTAFAPEKRFRDAQAVERALLGTEPALRNRRRMALGAGAFFALALLISCVFRWTTDETFGSWMQLVGAIGAPSAPRVSEAGFTEPLIEEAVRLFLKKDADDPISSEELSSVTELYITHDTACANVETFFQVHKRLCAEDFGARGPIIRLQDLKLLPHLRVLCVAAQQIQDISALSSLTELFQVELRFNSVSDITPLAGMKDLAVVGLNSNPVTDISPLASLGALKCLDLCGAEDYDGSALALLGDLDFLDISNSTDSYLYLGGRSVAELKLARARLTDLSCLREVRGIQKLEVSGSQITDLKELENHPEITCLGLGDIPVTDFSVLLQLPNLKIVVVSPSAKERVESVAKRGAFDVIYE